MAAHTSHGLRSAKFWFFHTLFMILNLEWVFLGGFFLWIWRFHLIFWVFGIFLGIIFIWTNFLSRFFAPIFLNKKKMDFFQSNFFFHLNSRDHNLILFGDFFPIFFIIFSHSSLHSPFSTHFELFSQEKNVLMWLLAEFHRLPIWVASFGCYMALSSSSSFSHTLRMRFSSSNFKFLLNFASIHLFSQIHSHFWIASTKPFQNSLSSFIHSLPQSLQ